MKYTKTSKTYVTNTVNLELNDREVVLLRALLKGGESLIDDAFDEIDRLTSDILQALGEVIQ